MQLGHAGSLPNNEDRDSKPQSLHRELGCGGGCYMISVKTLLVELNRRGYTGSHSHLARFLAPWRKAIPVTTMTPANSSSLPETEVAIPPRMAALDPMTVGESRRSLPWRFVSNRDIM